MLPFIWFHTAPCNTSSTVTTTLNAVTSVDVSVHLLQQYDDANRRLVHDNADVMVDGEFARRYSLIDVATSVMIANLFHQTLAERTNNMLLESHTASKEHCTKLGDSVLNTGGWCLKPGHSGSITWNKDTFMIPIHHARASGRIAREILTFIEQENISSINDFGAGVGQYKDAILRERPDVEWNAYDGAGNTYEYTKGFVNYFDLTLPLDLPKADWVLSLEVGEHIPSTHEGMVIRNLHHHNCKGVILSWGVVGQRGHSHVNNHSNNYIISLFKELGYTEDLNLKEKLRNPDDNYDWFVGSVMVFRRLNTHPSLGCSVKAPSYER